MRKRVKRLNLNQSTKSHDKLLIKNLFTSLLTYGKLVTTKPRASALKAYALKKVHDYEKATAVSRDLKRWLKDELSTQKFLPRITNKLKLLHKDFAVSSAMVQPRKGDNSAQYEVSIINFDTKVENEK